MKNFQGKLVNSALLALDEADQRKSFAQLVKEDLLNDDMLAVEYPNNFFLHVGWYADEPQPEGNSLTGRFEVVLTENQDLETPVCVWRCKSFDDLGSVVQFIDEWVSRKSSKR